MRLATGHCSGMDTEDTKMGETIVNGEAGSSAVAGPEADKPGDRMFTLKKWNAVAMWSWDVECDTCAICRQVCSILHTGCLHNKVDHLENYQISCQKLKRRSFRLKLVKFRVKSSHKIGRIKEH